MIRGISFGSTAASRLRTALPATPFIFAIFAIVACVALLASPALAQRTNGVISGAVTDQAGAAVGGASVTVRQPATGFSRTVQTTADGLYTVPELPAGTYTVTISRDGFRETVVSNVVVNTSTTTTQNVSLEVGEVSATVSITADVVQIETQTGAVGEIVSGEQVRELPLNGRSFVQLTQLQPGVSAANNFDPKQKGLFGGVDFSVNGNSAQSNLFLTDGANNNDTGSNRTILLFPSIEAIEEFKVLRNAYGPEYGQAAGAIVSIVTRGGSNEFHGSLFYFGRNDALNATEFFANRTGIGKNALRRNDYGGSIGGPIVKDRAFFFFSTEWNKEIRGQSRFGSVPTTLERQGNFSQPRFAPDGTRCSPDNLFPESHPAFGTNIIPAANLSQAGLTLVRIFPEPNISSPTSCTNWAQSANSPIDFNEYNLRFDGRINGKNKIFGRFTNDDWSNATPILTGNLWGDDAFPTIESTWAQPSRQLAVKLTTELSATAINEVQFSYSANRINVDPGNGGDLNAEINNAIPGFFPDSAKVNGVNRPHPVFWGGIAPYYSSSGPDLWTQAPFRNSLDIYSIRDDVSWVTGNHTVRFGGLLDKAAKDEDSGPNNEAVQFWGPSACCGGPNDGPFSGNWSNGMLQDLLTEGSQFGFNETSTMAVGQNRYTNFELYVGDSWRLRPNLTLELGARYSIFFEPYDERDFISGFLPSAYDPSRPASDPCNGLVVPAGTNPCSGIAGASTPTEFSNRSLRENSFGNIAPRLGVAWDVFGDGKTAVRAGLGQFYLRERTSIYFASLTQNAPFVTSIAGRRTLDGSAYYDLPAASNGRPQFGLSPEAATPYSLQFNVSVARELWKDTVVEVGYVGNRARNQLTHSDVNQVLEQNRVQAAFAGDANGVNQFRPFSNYGTIYVFERNGRADYDSLQVLFRTRFTSKSSFQAAYTYSQGKADFGLNDSSGGTSNFAVLDRTQRDLDFAPSDINRPHIFVANFIYNLPRLRNANPFVQAVAGGWEFASIIQISSGNSVAPILNATGISTGPDSPLQGGITGLGTGVANQRPLRVEGVPCRIDTPKGSFFNPDAWTLEGFRIGETTPERTTCEGPRTKNVDFSIYKNFGPGWLKKTFGEGARVQFRLELFNAFNTPQFNGALPAVYYDGQVFCGANPCSPTNNLITDFNNVNGNFGVATSTRGGREIQYALKFYF